jgi:hypothetical protein
MTKHVLFGLTVVLLSGCASAPQYGPPEASGLIGGQPFPTAADVCQTIGENERTANLLDDDGRLIGCPLSEAGAIKDRIDEGGEVVEVEGDWVLITMPGR